MPVSKFCSSAFKHLQNMIPVAPCPSCSHLLPGLLPGWPCWSACFHSGPKPSPYTAGGMLFKSKSVHVLLLLKTTPLASNSPRLKSKVLTMAHRLPCLCHFPSSFLQPHQPPPVPPTHQACSPLRPLLHLLLSPDPDALDPDISPAPFSPTFSLCSKNHHLMWPSLTTLFELATLTSLPLYLPRAAAFQCAMPGPSSPSPLPSELLEERDLRLVH